MTKHDHKATLHLSVVLSMAKTKEVETRGTWILPNDSCASTEVETIFHEAVAQSERKKVAGAIRRVAVVQHQTVIRRRQEHDLNVVECQHGRTQSSELQVRIAIELGYDHFDHFITVTTSCHSYD